MPDAPTLVAGRYRLGDELGRGGMGRVWHARDEVLQRDVAIKEIILPPDLVARDRDAAHRRTLREARAAARLGHPNVVQVFDVFEVDGNAWIVMAYVPCRSLHEVLRDGPIDPRRAARIGLDLLAALRAAHASGVDHRDVKPANVLLADDGRVLLTDFGIATIEGDSQVSSSDMLVGSPEYMSPERARYGTAGLASDLWSLGATLYAAVEGRSPYHRRSALATLTALAADEPDPPRQAGVLAPVLEGLLRKDPKARITAAEAEHLLRTAATGAYGHALVTPPPVPDREADADEAPRGVAVIPAPRTPASGRSAPTTAAGPADGDGSDARPASGGAPAREMPPAASGPASSGSASVRPASAAPASVPPASAAPASVPPASVPPGSGTAASAVAASEPAVPGAAAAPVSAAVPAPPATSRDQAKSDDSDLRVPAEAESVSGTGPAEPAPHAVQAPPAAAAPATGAAPAALASKGGESAPADAALASKGGGSAPAHPAPAPGDDDGPPVAEQLPGSDGRGAAMAATGSPTDLGVVSGSAPGGAGTEPAVGSEDSPRDVRSGSRAAPEGVATKAGATKAGAPEAVASDPAAPEAGVPDDLGSGGRRRRLAVVAAVLAVLVVAGIAWFVVDRSRSDPRDRTTAGVPVGSPAAPTSATATASGAGPGGSGPGGTGDPSGGGPAGPAATATPSGAPSSPPATTPAAAGTVLPQRPAGWIDYRDRTGFALYVPQGWTRSQEGSIVYFRDRSSARVLGIDQTRRPRPNPVADWRGKADYRVARGDFPSYREIHIREVDYFRKAADWEFTFVRGGVRQHVNNRGLITADDQAYGIYWQTRNADWSRYRGDLQLIFDSFRPARRS